MEYILCLIFLIAGFVTRDFTFHIVAALFCIGGNIDSFRTSWLKHHDE